LFYIFHTTPFLIGIGKLAFEIQKSCEMLYLYNTVKYF